MSGLLPPLHRRLSLFPAICENTVARHQETEQTPGRRWCTGAHNGLESLPAGIIPTQKAERIRLLGHSLKASNWNQTTHTLRQEASSRRSKDGKTLLTVVLGDSDTGVHDTHTVYWLWTAAILHKKNIKREKGHALLLHYSHKNDHIPGPNSKSNETPWSRNRCLTLYVPEAAKLRITKS